MYQVNIHEAKTNLSKLITKVVNGEEVVIAKGNKPVVKIIKFNAQKVRRKLGSALGHIKISEDFDDQLDDFREYME